MNTQVIRKQNRQALIVLVALFAFIASLLFMANTANAQVTNVLDNAGVMNERDINEINNINDEDLAKVKGHPQIAVITEKNVDDIEDFAQNQFEKYHFGRKGLDNGILVVISIDNHKIRIQTGYGVEGAVPDVWAGSDAVDGTPKELFRDGEYSEGVTVIVRRIAKRLTREEGSIKSKDEIIADKRQKAEDEAEFNREISMMVTDVKWLVLIVVIAMLCGTVIYVLRQKKEEKRSRKFMTDVLSTSVAKNHHFMTNPYEENVRHGNDMIYLADEMMDQSPYMDDLKLAASVLILNNAFEKLYDHTEGQIRVKGLGTLKSILDKSPLDTVLDRVGYLTAHWKEFDRDFDQACADTMTDIFTKVIDDPHPVYDTNNKEQIKTAFNKIVKKASKDFNWYPMLEKAVISYVKTGKKSHASDLMSNSDYESLHKSFEKVIMDNSLDYTLAKVDGQPNLTKVMNRTSYSEKSAYRHLSNKNKAKFIDAVDAGDMTLAASFLVGAMLAMQDEARREAERRRREEEEERLRRERDDDDDNNFFGGGGFGGGFGGGSFGGGGDFGGFGGDSGGGGATSSW